MTSLARWTVARAGRAVRRVAGRGRGPATTGLPVHHFGVTRFSLFDPDSAAWRLTRRGDWPDAEAYAEHLFSEERMGPRCDIFCDLAAPLYQQMAEGHSFRQMVLYSAIMPQRWKDRLEQAAERYPVLWLIESEGGSPDVKSYLREHLRTHSSGQNSLVFAFRVDDDDLLSADYLDQVEPYVTAQHHDHAISFSSGFAALYENGTYTRVAPWHQRLSSIGQGSIGTWRAQEERLALTLIGNHNRTDRGRTVLLDGRRPTFLQTRHIGQDTAVKETEPLDAERARSALIAGFGRLPTVTDLQMLLDRFPSLSGRIELAD